MKRREEIEAIPDIERRIKTAELCGWTHCDVTLGSCGGAVYENDVWFLPGHPFPQTADWIAANGRVNPPDYLNSLDTMHEAEKDMIQHNLATPGGYVMALRKLTGVVGNCTAYFAIVHATARQRNTAFLMTLL